MSRGSLHGLSRHPFPPKIRAHRQNHPILRQSHPILRHLHVRQSFHVLQSLHGRQNHHVRQALHALRVLADHLVHVLRRVHQELLGPYHAFSLQESKLGEWSLKI